MHDEAAQTEERCPELASTIEGKKTAILDSARETKQDGSIQLAADEDPNESEG